MNEPIFDILIVGGGASGMMAALEARRNGPSLRIGVLERMNRVGKKLMATGNGRCNLTNLNAAPERRRAQCSSVLRNTACIRSSRKAARSIR